MTHDWLQFRRLDLKFLWMRGNVCSITKIELSELYLECTDTALEPHVAHSHPLSS